MSLLLSNLGGRLIPKYPPGWARPCITGASEGEDAGASRTSAPVVAPSRRTTLLCKSVSCFKMARVILPLLPYASRESVSSMAPLDISS